MTGFGIARLLVYLAGMGASSLSLMDIATFDPETWMLDFNPFRLDEVVRDCVTFVGSTVASLAVWRKWRVAK